LGKGKTTLRGGYSISYSAVGNFGDYAGILTGNAGSAYTFEDKTSSANKYFDLTTLGTRVPTPIASYTRLVPGTSGYEPIDKGDQTLSMYDPNIRSPYVQNLSLSLTRNIGNSLTVDVRYIGTLSRKIIGTVNINAANFMNLKVVDPLNTANSATFIHEMNTIRAGGASTILDNMFNDGKITGGTVGATFSNQLRASGSTKYALAAGDYNTIASFLQTDNGGFANPEGSSQHGMYLAGNNQPLNLFKANPQYGTAAYTGVNITANRRHSNYHSMQAQVTMRPTRGLSFQTTYTWSRNLADAVSTTDLRDPSLDYWLSDQHRLHALTSYGTFDLPMGANGFILRNAGGVLKKAVEGWQLSWVSSLTSGMPGSIGMGGAWYTTGNTLWANGAPDLVGPFDPKDGKVTWADGADNGKYFGTKYYKGSDPVCSSSAVAASLNFACGQNLKALYIATAWNAKGEPSAGTQVVLKNPAPGERGNFQPNSMIGSGRWALDLAMSKSIEFMEGKRIDFRVDAQNILNHASPTETATVANARYTQVTNPNFNLNNGDTFGDLKTKGGHRTFQAKLRITF
jgi:hypothetical protein